MSEVSFPESTESPVDGSDEGGTLRCPKCGSPSPELHPATQHEGEVMTICTNEYHSLPGGTVVVNPEEFPGLYKIANEPPSPDLVERPVRPHNTDAWAEDLEEENQELAEAIEALTNEAIEIGKENQRRQEAIQKITGTPLDGIAENRHELFFEFLVENGIIPKLTKAQFELAWAQHFSKILIKLQLQLDKQMKAAESENIRRRLLMGTPSAAQMPRGHRPKIKDNPQA
jgi:hypothetical protein